MNRKMLIFLIVIGILFSGCINKEVNTEKDEQQVPNTSINNKIDNNNSGRIDIFMKLEKTNFSVGEEIKINLSLENRGKYPIILENNTNGNFEIVLYPINKSENLSSPILIKDPYTDKVTIQPGNVLLESIKWNQAYSVNDTDRELAPGKYKLVAYLRAVISYQDSKDIYKFKSYALKTKSLTINIE